MTPSQILKESLGELVNLYVAPNRRDTVKECVLGNAEYKGTVRINASAIPLFRNVKHLLTTHTIKLLQAEIERLEGEKKECRMCTNFPSSGVGHDLHIHTYNQALKDILTSLRQSLSDIK